MKEGENSPLKFFPNRSFRVSRISKFFCTNFAVLKGGGLGGGGEKEEKVIICGAISSIKFFEEGDSKGLGLEILFFF